MHNQVCWYFIKMFLIIPELALLYMYMYSRPLLFQHFLVFPPVFIKNLNLRLATTWKYALGVLSLRGKVFNGRKCYCHRRSVMDIEKLMRIPLSTDIWRVQIHLINILHAKQSYYIQPLLQINLQLTGLCSHIIFIDS